MSTTTTEQENPVLDCEGYRKLLAQVEDQEKKWNGDVRPRQAMIWAVNRAKNWAEKVGITPEEVLDLWENGRTYWHVNYYQDANFPMLQENVVRLFDTQDDLLKAIGKPQFRCPACAGVSTSPYECDSGRPLERVKRGAKAKPCDWKVYGLFRDLGKGVTVFVKEKIRCERIFTPIAWEPKPEFGQNVTLEAIEIRHIGEVLAKADTLDKAAEILGIDIATLYRKRVRYGFPMKFTSGEKKETTQKSTT